MGKTQYMTTANSSVYIDPTGADQDKREINNAIKEINDALTQLKKDNLDESLFRGYIFEGTRQKLQDYTKRLETLRGDCERAREDIAGIVDHYVALDSEVQRKVAQTMSGSSGRGSW